MILSRGKHPAVWDLHTGEVFQRYESRIDAGYAADDYHVGIQRGSPRVAVYSYVHAKPLRTYSLPHPVDAVAGSDDDDFFGHLAVNDNSGVAYCRAGGAAVEEDRVGGQGEGGNECSGYGGATRLYQYVDFSAI